MSGSGSRYVGRCLSRLESRYVGGCLSGLESRCARGRTGRRADENKRRGSGGSRTFIGRRAYKRPASLGGCISCGRRGCITWCIRCYRCCNRIGSRCGEKWAGDRDPNGFQSRAGQTRYGLHSDKEDFMPIFQGKKERQNKAGDKGHSHCQEY